MLTNKTNLTLEEFWALPEGETAYELVNGEAIPKVSPKYFHSTLQKALLTLIYAWCKGKGRILPEWAVRLKRNGRDWVPAPDLTYVSYSQIYTGNDKIVDTLLPGLELTPQLIFEEAELL